MTLQIDGLSPGDISGQRLRMTVGRTLGWRLLKSTAFDVRRTSRGYRFSGRGFGHGVGFCVIGAARRAAGGATRARLLDQYFPGLAVARVTADMLRAPVLSPPDPEVPLDSGDASTADVPVSRRATPAPPPPTASVPSPPPSPVLRPAPQAASVPRTARGVGLVLPSADERDRPHLEAMIERALAAAAARIGRSAPGRVDVVFHVSAEAFAQTTGEPLWSEGVTRGTRIDLQPVQILRDRGALDEAVRHEAAHVVTGAALAGRATWVREGAAFFAAGTLREADIARAGRERERPPCPSDAEFERSAPEAVYDAAAARARMCFARALASGLRWDEVR
jgi:hypothetical protein